MSTPTVDAVIVTANTRDLVMAALGAIPAGSLASVVVVDNGSTDGTAATISASRPDVDVVVVADAVGFAEACNRGAARGTADTILFLNSDVVAGPGAIDRLTATLDEGTPAVAAGGRLVDPGTDATQVAYRPRRFPTAASLAVQAAGVARAWPGNPVTATHNGAGLPDDRISVVDQPAGACLLVRRDAFAAVGGFDERFWFWFEDVDLARRLQGQGPLLYVPQAIFEHHGGASFAAWSSAATVRSRMHGLLRYQRLHASRRERALVGAAYAVSECVRAVAAGDVLARTAHLTAARAAAELACGRRPGPAARALRHWERGDRGA